MRGRFEFSKNRRKGELNTVSSRKSADSLDVFYAKMPKEMKPLFYSVQIVALLLPASGFAQGQHLARGVGFDTVRLESEITLDFVSATEGLSALLRGLKIPGGVAAVSGCPGEVRKTLRIPGNIDLRSALDAGHNLYENYRWNIEAGVTNFLPKDTMPALLTPISRLEWDTGSSASLSLNRLSRVAANNLAQLGFISGLNSGLGLQKPPRVVDGVAIPLPPGKRFSVENTSLLGALNAIVASYGAVVWTYVERRCDQPPTFQLSVH